MFKIAIIGRPNVGKSSLFNKLVGRKFAIVDNMPGVTRDRREAYGSLGPMRFKVIDTAGVVDGLQGDELEARMVQQSEMATVDADISLFVVDGREGLNAQDKSFAKWLREKGLPVILVANKRENMDGEVFDAEYYKLGFGEAVAISAEHNQGMNFLYDEIEPYYDKYQKEFAKYSVDAADRNDGDDENGEGGDKTPLQIAIVGRPNAGKSTFLNALLDEERVIVGAEAGITRDSIAVDFEFEGRKIKLIDTAGIRKKSNVVHNLEKESLNDSFRAIRYAHIVVLMLSFEEGIDKQDMAIASMVIDEGRGLIFAVNKSDLADDKDEMLENVKWEIKKNAPEIRGVPVMAISALKDKNVHKVIKKAFEIYSMWQRYIPTSKLNQWLRIVQEEHPPPLEKGRAVKLKYITQAKKRPPTFVLFSNHPKKIEGSYKRYLVNHLRKSFNLMAVPLRIILRKEENPFEGVKYKNKKKKR